MIGELFNKFFDQVFHGGFSVFGEFLFYPVGYNGIQGKTIMSQQFCHPYMADVSISKLLIRC